MNVCMVGYGMMGVALRSAARLDGVALHTLVGRREEGAT
jgi:hypothetical protein